MGAETNELPRKDLIEILLKEYEGLRTELLQRIGSRFALLGYFGAVGAYVGTQDSLAPMTRILVLAGGITVLLVMLHRYGVVVLKCNERLVEIEAEVNSLVGKPLLKWEARMSAPGRPFVVRLNTRGA